MYISRIRPQGESKEAASYISKQIKGDPPRPIKTRVPYGVSHVNQASLTIQHLWMLQTTRLKQRSKAAHMHPSPIIDSVIDNALWVGFSKPSIFERMLTAIFKSDVK
jgi:hypothetical protein